MVGGCWLKAPMASEGPCHSKHDVNKACAPCGKPRPHVQVWEEVEVQMEPPSPSTWPGTMGTAIFASPEPLGRVRCLL